MGGLHPVQSVKKAWNLFRVVQGRATRMEFWGFAVFVEGLTLLFSLPLWLYSSFVQADDFFVSGAFSPRPPLYLEIFHQLVFLHTPVLLLCLPLGGLWRQCWPVACMMWAYPPSGCCFRWWRVWCVFCRG